MEPGHKFVREFSFGESSVVTPISNEEAVLLENGSEQKNIWGINLYPEIEGDDFIEFDSMINMRPSQGNMSRGVDSEEIQTKIKRIVNERIEK